MSRGQRFDVLIKVAEAREQEAARALADDNTSLEEAQGKLRDLLAYQSDYARDFSKGIGIRFAAQLRDHGVFLDRLGLAIEAQRQEIDRRADALEASKRRWQEERKQLEILRKVAERSRMADRIAADKRDQKWMDELAGAAYARSCTQN